MRSSWDIRSWKVAPWILRGKRIKLLIIYLENIARTSNTWLEREKTTSTPRVIKPLANQLISTMYYVFFQVFDDMTAIIFNFVQLIRVRGRGKFALRSVKLSSILTSEENTIRRRQRGGDKYEARFGMQFQNNTLNKRIIFQHRVSQLLAALKLYHE